MLLWHQGFRSRRGLSSAPNFRRSGAFSTTVGLGHRVLPDGAQESVELRSTRQPGAAVSTWLPVVPRRERDARGHIWAHASLSPADHLME